MIRLPVQPGGKPNPLEPTSTSLAGDQRRSGPKLGQFGPGGPEIPGPRHSRSGLSAHRRAHDDDADGHKVY